MALAFFSMTTALTAAIIISDNYPCFMLCIGFIAYYAGKAYKRLSRTPTNEM
jgi:hypothetical protein